MGFGRRKSKEAGRKEKGGGRRKEDDEGRGE